ncbi:hypothetical protein GCM10010199_56490 [Dactylosporangium roseum]
MPASADRPPRRRAAPQSRRTPGSPGDAPPSVRAGESPAKPPEHIAARQRGVDQLTGKAVIEAPADAYDILNG